MKYDFLVVGAGFYGCTFARAVAEQGKTVLLLEKDYVVGGLSKTRKYDLFKQIQYHVYGPHILHTDSLEVWNFLKKFDTINNFKYTPLVNNNGNYYSFPFNKLTMQQLGIRKINPPEKADNTNFETYVISRIGKKAYKTLYYGYTKKMWGMEPRELPASIAQRIPIRNTLNNSYYDHTYQGIPKNGYTDLLINMVTHKNIDISMGDFRQDKNFYRKQAKKIIYTGSIDEYYDYRFGQLPYRMVDITYFETEATNTQECIAINYATGGSHTRSICHNYWLQETEKLPVKLISYEVPMQYDAYRYCKGHIPMYPVKIGPEAKAELYDKYVKYNQATDNMIFKGRLGEFVYRDMCPTIEEALKFAKTFA